MTSLIWDHFSKALATDGARIAECTTCKKTYNRAKSNTSVLWRHLERHHPEKYAATREKSKDEQKFLKLLAEWIVCSNQPFSCVENPSFLKMMGHSSKFKPPSRYMLTNKILPAMEKETKAKIKAQLKDQRPSLTADVWEDGDVALVSITAHYIDSEFTPRNASFTIHSVILGAKVLQGSHSADNISKVMEECLKEYDISESASSVTTDSAATMTATIRKLGKANLVCCSHQIHLVVTEALSGWSLDGAIQQCRKFARFIHKSGPARKSLRRRLEGQTGPNKAPIRGVPRDCNVRWNSTYLMIDAIIEKIDIVNEVLEEFGRERIADEDGLQLQKAAKLLKEFYHQTLNLSEEFTPATEVIPIMTELIAFCDQFVSSSTGEVVELAMDLRTNLRSRIIKYTSDVNLLSLMLLDPRLAKDSQLVPAYLHDDIRKKLTEWFKPATSTASTTRPPVNRATAKFRNLIAERESQQVGDSPSIDLDEELDRYLAELTLNKVRLDQHPLEWWRVHQYSFPNLALAAREALALQATSVQSERLFSKIGLLFQNKLRNRLQGESAERSVLIACSDMGDIARKLSCEKVLVVSLREEGEELKEGEQDGDEEEEEDQMVEEGEPREEDIGMGNEASTSHNLPNWENDSFYDMDNDSPASDSTQSNDSDEFFASI